MWLVGGTRPEALKLAPVVLAMESQRYVRPVVISTGQHPEMFQQGLATFGLCPDVDLAVHRATGSQAEFVSRTIELLDARLDDGAPAAVIVQGDTSTALATAMASFWRGVPVVHLEAGLRSHDLSAPFPEESNRRMIAPLASLHLAPTSRAAANLVAEGVDPARVRVIGNTVVDTVLAVARRHHEPREPALGDLAQRLASGGQVSLVTTHRRESWGEPLRSVLGAVRDLVDRHPDLSVVLPVHPNPLVSAEVLKAIPGHERIVVTGPLDYPDLVWVLQRCTLVLSDSGGIQEEAPTFGVPVLVLRDVTERLEAVDAGLATLVGTDRRRVVETASRLLAGCRPAARPAALANPFGDGYAAPRAVAAVSALLRRPSRAASATAPQRSETIWDGLRLDGRAVGTEVTT